MENNLFPFVNVNSMSIFLLIIQIIIVIGRVNNLTKAWTGTKIIS